jgi:phosphopantetheine adenylyltransferase
MNRLDLIIKAIDIAITQNSHDMIMTGEELRKCAQALAAARELRALEPVAIVALDGMDQISVGWISKPRHNDYLYALGDTNE